MANQQHTMRDRVLPAAFAGFPAAVGTGIEQSVTDLILSAERAVASAEAKAMDRKRLGYPTHWRDGRSGPGEHCHYACLVAESYKVPEVDGIQLTGREKSLRADGWRFVPLPKIVRRTGDDKHRALLGWEVLAGWIAIPPESSGCAARKFHKKLDAMRWAEALA